MYDQCMRLAGIDDNNINNIDNILCNAMPKLQVLCSYDGLYHYYSVITVFLGIWHMSNMLSLAFS